jgi:hypothetical protein
VKLKAPFKVPFKVPFNPAALAGGLVVVMCVIGGVLYIQRGAHVDLKGSVLKVRTLAMDESSSVAAIDFRFVNPANAPFVVQGVDVSIEDKSGNTVDGAVVAEIDARRLFEYYPALGQKYNDSLVARTKIPGSASMDRMVVARFEVPESVLASRKNLKVKITDVDGPEAELQEAKR